MNDNLLTKANYKQCHDGHTLYVHNNVPDVNCLSFISLHYVIQYY